MASNLQIIINGVDNATGTFNDVGDAMTGLESKSGSLLSKGLGPLQNVLGVGLKAAAGIAAVGIGALGAGLASSIGDASDFQQSMADIQASMGASADETDKLKKLILDLGIDPKLKVSAQEAAQAIGQLGTAGVSIDDILKGTARSTVLLANATGADFAEAASIASDVSKLWEINAGDLGHAVDGITAATVASKFNINDYRLALAQAGGVASTVGVSFDDFNATIAAISPSFASGSDAGTSFKVFLQRLIPSSTKAEDSMKALGLISTDYAKAAQMLSKTLGHEVAPTMIEVNKAQQQLVTTAGGLKVGSKAASESWRSFIAGFQQNEFYNANGQMKDMDQIVGVLHKSFSGLTEEQKNQQLSIIFGTDAMRAAAAMAKMTKTDFDNLAATMGKTDAADSAKIRMDTLKGSLEILSGTFDTLKLMIGDKFLPVLNDMVKRFNDFLAAQAPTIVAWAGQLATKLGDLITNYLPIFITKLGEWWQWTKQLAVTVADVAVSVYTFMTNVKTALQPVIDIASRFIGLKEILIGVAAAFGVSAVVSIGAFIASITPVIAVVGSAIAIVAALRTAWTNDFGGIQGIVGGVLGYLKDRFSLLWDFIKIFGPGALQEIGAWVSGTQTQFTNLSHIWDQVKLTAQLLFNDLVSYVRNSLPGWIAQLQSWGVATWQWIVNSMPMVLAKLSEWATALFNWVVSSLPGWIAQLQSWGVATWQWIVNSMPMVLAKLSEWATALFNWVVSSLPGWIAKFVTWETAMWQWIGNAIPQAIDQLTAWVNTMSTWAGPGGAGNGELLAMFGKLSIAMLEALGKIGLALAKLALTVALDLIIALAQGLLNWAGIDVNLWRIKDGILANISGWLGNIGQKAGEIVIAIANGIMGGMPSLDTVKNTFFDWGSSAILRMREGFLAAQNMVRNGLDLVMDFIQQGRDARLPAFQQSLYDAGSNAVSKLGQGFGAARQFAADNFNQVMTDVQNQGLGFAGGALLGRMYEGGRNFILRVGEGIASASPGLAGNLSGAFTSLRDGFNWWHDNLVPHFLGSAQDLAGKIGAGFAGINLGAAVNNAFVSLRDTYNRWRDDLANHFFGSMSDLGARVIDGLSSGIQAGIGRVLSAIQGVTNALPQWVKDQLGIHSPSTVFAGLGKNIMEGFVQGMQSMANAPLDVLSGVTAGMTGGIGNLQLPGSGGGNSTVSNATNNSTTHNWNVTIPTAGGNQPNDQMSSLFNTLTNVYAS